MAANKTNLRAVKDSIKPITPGFYTYHTAAESPDQFRLHLRVEPDGEGILVVNASTVLHLNQTATEFAYHLIQGKDNVQIVDAMSQRYNVTREVLMRDVQLFIDQILYLGRENDLSPSATIGFESHVFDKNLTAPLRIDCCLTYSSFSDGDSNLLTTDELTTEDWKAILTKLFNAGIPHVVFFGGEPTLRQDLLEIMAFTEQLGLVSGLVSSDPNLKNLAILLPLIEAGLDHLTFSLDPANTDDMQDLSNILDQDLFTTLRIPIHSDRDYHDLIHQLEDLGANAFNLLPEDEFSHAHASHLQHELSESGIVFVDDMPAAYHHHETQVLFSIWDPDSQPSQQFVIQPDGNLADHAGSQDNYGNLLVDEWSSLWSRVIAGGAI
jgi:hypothetical protein